MNQPKGENGRRIFGISLICGDYLVTRHFCNGSELLPSSYYISVSSGILHGKI